MRIAINATAVGDRFNGVTTSTEALIDGLRRSQQNVFVYSSNRRFGSVDGVTLRETPANLALPGNSLTNLRRSWWLQNSFPSILKRDGMELLIGPSVEGLIRPSLPQVITVHDLMPLFYREENPRLYYYYRYILPRILRQTELVITVSEFTRQDLLRTMGISPDRAVVAPPGLPDRLFEPAGAEELKSGDEPFFLFVGSFSPRKNLETVLRAFAQIETMVSESLLVIAYPDRWKDGMVRLADQLKISDRVAFRSGLSNPELASLYRNATALVLMSEYEGFGLPPLEAMALGTPAIVSNSTSLAEVVGDSAVKLPSRDVSAVASAMQSLSTDPHLRSALRQRGSQQAAKYNRSRSIELLNRTLNPLLQRLAAA